MLYVLSRETQKGFYVMTQSKRWTIIDASKYYNPVMHVHILGICDLMASEGKYYYHCCRRQFDKSAQFSDKRSFVEMTWLVTKLKENTGVET